MGKSRRDRGNEIDLVDCMRGSRYDRSVLGVVGTTLLY